ncbi:MAG: hypothetical protein LBM93_05860 [Oscillospiraceae bacterium]|jgi:hypothetical protein|nr:hypothetical protein [Oscillospiraceae bacterium]
MKNNNLKKHKHTAILWVCVGVFLAVTIVLLAVLMPFKSEKKSQGVNNFEPLEVGITESYSVTNPEPYEATNTEPYLEDPIVPGGADENIFDIDFTFTSIRVPCFEDAEKYCVDADGNEVLLFTGNEDYERILADISETVVNPPNSMGVQCLSEPLYQDVIDRLEQVDFEKYNLLAFYRSSGTGSVSYNVKSVTVNEPIIQGDIEIAAVPYLNITCVSEIPEVCTDDMAGDWILISVDKAQYAQYFGESRPYKITGIYSHNSDIDTTVPTTTIPLKEIQDKNSE